MRRINPGYKLGGINKSSSRWQRKNNEIPGHWSFPPTMEILSRRLLPLNFVVGRFNARRAEEGRGGRLQGAELGCFPVFL